MPNATVAYLRSLTPAAGGPAARAVHAVDEYVHADLD